MPGRGLGDLEAVAAVVAVSTTCRSSSSRRRRSRTRRGSSSTTSRCMARQPTRSRSCGTTVTLPAVAERRPSSCRPWPWPLRRPMPDRRRSRTWTLDAGRDVGRGRRRLRVVGRVRRQRDLDRLSPLAVLSVSVSPSTDSTVPSSVRPPPSGRSPAVRSAVRAARGAAGRRGTGRCHCRSVRPLPAPRPWMPARSSGRPRSHATDGDRCRDDQERR